MKTHQTQTMPTRNKDSLGSIIGHLAGVIASENFPTGERAALKRLTPRLPPSLKFYRFAFRHLPQGWEAQQAEWMAVVSGIALMCPEPHRPDRPVGRALAEAGYSEARLERLLAAEGEDLHTLVLRAARFLAAKAEAVNWVDLACLLLTRDKGKLENVRFKFARDYYPHLEKKE